jgi:hypothetical protein
MATHPGGIAAANLLLQQTQLVLLDLKLTRVRPPCIARPMALSLLMLKGLERPLCTVDPLFRSAKLLSAHEHA